MKNRYILLLFFGAAGVALFATMLRTEYIPQEQKRASVNFLERPFTIEPDSVLTPAQKTIYCYTGCYGRPEMGTIIMVNDTSVMEFKFSRVVKLK